MARKTKAELAAEAAVANAAAWKEFVDSYPARFSAMLVYYATHSNFNVTKLSDGLEYRFTHEWTDATLPVQVYTFNEPNWMVLAQMENVEDAVARADEAAAEEQRKYQVRTAALAKLSKEERELLGL